MWWKIVCLLALAAPAFAVSLFSFPEEVRERSASRIVSGWPAQAGQLPHQLSLRMVNPLGQVFSCGASIIHNEWAITAAHCTAQRVTIVVRVGSVNLTQPNAIFETTEYYNHPLYDEVISGIVQPHDIGVIKFNRYVQYNALVQPIRIQRSADKDFNYDQVRLVASGYGLTWTGGSSTEHLNWVYLLGDSHARCQQAFGNSPIIQPSTICASAYNVSSQSTCQGDSGGPLTTLEQDGKVTLVGVTSFVSGLGCHFPLPAGFIRPGYYHDWYTQVTGINFDWDWDIEGSGSEEYQPAQWSPIEVVPENF